jgi:rubrerythrin
MNSKEIKSLILEVYKEETLHRSRLNELRSRYQSEAKSLNEGLMDSAAFKVFSWLAGVLKKISPETFAKIDKAVKEKDKSLLDSIFNDPKVKEKEKQISNELLSEGLGNVISKIVNWIKTHKVATAYTALGLMVTIVGLIHAHGNPSEFIMLYWPRMQIGAVGGALGGGLVSGVGSLYKQLSKGSLKNVDWKDVGIDTLKGAGQGLAAGVTAAGLSGVGSSIAGAAGTATAAIPSLIKFLEKQPDGKDTFGMIYKHKNDPEYPHLKSKSDKIEQWKKWVDDPDNALEPEDLNQNKVKQYLLKFLQGNMQDDEFSRLDSFMERQGALSI